MTDRKQRSNGYSPVSRAEPPQVTALDPELDVFVTAAGWRDATAVALAGDASSRRYIRLQATGSSAILMDARSLPGSVEPFVTIGQWLASQSLSVPQLLYRAPDRPLLLLEDLGDGLFPDAIAAGVDETKLYGIATDILAMLHANAAPRILPDVRGSGWSLPHYGQERFVQEALLFLDWYWPAVLQRPADDSERGSFEALWRSLHQLGKLSDDRLVLMDYHSPNLMWLPDRQGLARVGILDFQDALFGSAAYDVVSLLQDPRRDVAEALETDLLAHYCKIAGPVSRGAFETAYAIQGAQRATRILGVFVRLWQRDGKPGYLKHMPRVWSLLERNLDRCIALRPLRQWLDGHVPAAHRGGAAQSLPTGKAQMQ